jgi:hypothetical protein
MTDATAVRIKSVAMFNSPGFFIRDLLCYEQHVGKTHSTTSALIARLQKYRDRDQLPIERSV